MSEVLENPGPEAIRAAIEMLPVFKEQPQEPVYLMVGQRRTQLNPFFVKLLMQIAEEVRQGRPISVVPHHAELTTQQAADLLNVSRPFVSKLIKNGELAHEMRGTHRRIRFDEILRYKAARAIKRREALKSIAQLSQDYGLPD